MLCYLLQQLKKKDPNLSLPSSLQVLMGTSGVCKNRLVMVRATKPSQLLPAVPHTSTHRGKSNRGLCQQNVNLCRPWGTRQLQNSNSKKNLLFQMFSAVAGGAQRIGHRDPYPGPELSTQHGTRELAGCESGKVSSDFISAQLYLLLLAFGFGKFYLS